MDLILAGLANSKSGQPGGLNQAQVSSSEDGADISDISGSPLEADPDTWSRFGSLQDLSSPMLEDKSGMHRRIVENVGELPKSETWGETEVSRLGFRYDIYDSDYVMIRYYNVDLIMKTGDAFFISYNSDIHDRVSSKCSVLGHVDILLRFALGAESLCMYCQRIAINDSLEAPPSFKVGTISESLKNGPRGCKFCMLVLLSFDKCSPHISTMGQHLLYAFIETEDPRVLKCITVDGREISNFTEMCLSDESSKFESYSIRY